MNIKKGMKLFEAFYNDDKDAYIKEWAIDDWETGQTFDPDDFDYFRKVAAEGGYKVNQADFDYYFECIDECREKEYYDEDEEELEEAFNKEIVYKGYHIINDKEYSGGYIITDKDGDDVTPGHIFKSIKDAKKEIDAGVAFPLNESYDDKKLKIRLIWDDCTPTRERRPTTEEDIDDDIHIEEFDNEEDFINAILDITNSYEEDLEEADGDDDFEKAKSLMGYCDDPGDGSPNFLYMSINGKEDDEYTFPYDCLDNLDLEHCTEEEVKEAIKSDYE